MPPPSPFLVNPVILVIQVKVDSIEFQIVQSRHQMQQANRNLKFFIIFSSVILTPFLISRLLCLGISLKLPYLEELTEKREEFLGAAGIGTDAESATQPDLSVGLAVVPETTAIPTPNGLDAGTDEDSSFHTLDFTPLRGAKV